MSKPRPVVTRVPPADPSPRSSARIQPSKSAATQIKKLQAEEPEGISTPLPSYRRWVQFLKKMIAFNCNLNLYLEEAIEIDEMDFDEPMEAENVEEEPVKVKAELETTSTVKVEPKTEPQDEMFMYVCNIRALNKKLSIYASMWQSSYRESHFLP